MHTSCDRRAATPLCETPHTFPSTLAAPVLSLGFRGHQPSPGLSSDHGQLSCLNFCQCLCPAGLLMGLQGTVGRKPRCSAQTSISHFSFTNKNTQASEASKPQGHLPGCSHGPWPGPGPGTAEVRKRRAHAQGRLGPQTSAHLALGTRVIWQGLPLVAVPNTAGENACGALTACSSGIQTRFLESMSIN